MPLRAPKASQHKRTLTVIVPSLNEENNLEPAVRNIQGCVREHFCDYEILLFNDGSTDRTGWVADRLAQEDPAHIKVIHHSKPCNLGGCYREGLNLAKHEFVIMIPGDNECGVDVMQKVFSMAGKADIVIPYTTNAGVRPKTRQWISKAFVELMNLFSGCRLKYYNGAVLHKTSVARSSPITNDGFGYQAELLVKLLRRGYSFCEVGTEITYRPSGRSKAFRLTNIARTLHFLAELAWEARLKSVLPKVSSPPSAPRNGDSRARRV